MLRKRSLDDDMPAFASHVSIALREHQPRRYRDRGVEHFEKRLGHPSSKAYKIFLNSLSTFLISFSAFKAVNSSVALWSCFFASFLPPF